MEKYKDMHELVKKNRDARKYYLSLPLNIQDAISSLAGTINSFEMLKNRADDLLNKEK